MHSQRPLGNGSGKDLATQKWLGLITAAMGMFLCSLDITVNVALPDITTRFSTDAQTIQWIILFYVGSSTGLQLSLGNAADIFGLKRFYISGVLVYTIAVLLIGLAPLLSLVFALRVLQAVGNSLIMVCAPALVTSIFAATERGKALGILTGVATLGMVVGALAGGALVDAFGWRAIFIARVPLGITVLVMSALWLQERINRDPRPYDFWGSMLLFTTLVSFILLLTLGGRHGWTSPSALVLLIASGISGCCFAYVEKKVDQPVFDLGLLKHRVLVPVVLTSYLMFVAIFVSWFILPFYVSDILQVNAKVLGFLLMLMQVLGAVTSPIGGWLSDRMPPAYLTTLALAVIAMTMYWFTWLGHDSTVAQVAFRMVAVGFGMGLFQAANATLIMGAVPSSSLGTGGALLAMSRSMGTVSSVALMGALFASRLDFHAIASTQQALTEKRGLADAFVSAFQDLYGVAAILAFIAVCISLYVWPSREGRA